MYYNCFYRQEWEEGKFVAHHYPYEMLGLYFILFCNFNFWAYGFHSYLSRLKPLAADREVPIHHHRLLLLSPFVVDGGHMFIQQQLQQRRALDQSKGKPSTPMASSLQIQTLELIV
ncbi:hypothetical protein RJ641_007632 [Dillenia turbinata]|uniref:Uncharacterized protein n=1 Tax=Dillenia turbinata TaxID=194707 RepID=A0AAN8UZM6_9MAGN